MTNLGYSLIDNAMGSKEQPPPLARGLQPPGRESSEIRVRLARGEPGPATPSGGLVALEMDWDDDAEVPTLRRAQAAQTAQTAAPHAVHAEAMRAAKAAEHRAAYPELASEPLPTDRRRVGGVIAMASVIGLLCTLFVALYLAAPVPTGQLSFRTEPGPAEVLVDGEFRGSSDPVIVLSLTADRPHSLQVRRSGYRPWWTEVRVRAGRPLRLAPVTLLPLAAPDAPDAPDAPEAPDAPRPSHR